MMCSIRCLRCSILACLVVLSLMACYAQAMKSSGSSMMDLSFRHNVDAALERVKGILDNTRHPAHPANVPHAYEDKYILVEGLSNAALEALLNTYQLLVSEGTKQDESTFAPPEAAAAADTTILLQNLKKWVTESKRKVIMRFTSEMKCKYGKQVVKTIESPTVSVTTSHTGKAPSTCTQTNTTEITEYSWDVEHSWTLSAFPSNNPAEAITLQTHTSFIQLITPTNSTPQPALSMIGDRDVDITHFLVLLDVDSVLTTGKSPFALGIDREDKDCHTPRRNDDVATLVKFMLQLQHWSQTVLGDLHTMLITLHQDYKVWEPLLTAIEQSNDKLFVPIIPLLDDKDKRGQQQQRKGRRSQLVTSEDDEGAADEQVATAVAGEEEEEDESGDDTDGKLSSPASSSFSQTMSQSERNIHLSAADMRLFMAEQKRSLSEQLDVLVKTFGTSSDGAATGGNDKQTSATTIMSINEARLCLLLQHLRSITEAFVDGVALVEEMLEQQIISAIGKEVTSSDMAEFMKYHSRRLFAEDVKPSSFQYDIRRAGGFSPEGTLSIEATYPSRWWDAGQDGAGASAADGPITTIVQLREAAKAPPMKFALNAATFVSFHGPQYLHGYIQHKFSNDYPTVVHGTTQMATTQHQLVARARQFSSFVLLIGRIASAELFEPVHAIIVKDKDEVLLPLLLDPLPTPKEFQDSIQSLSPEQQIFARAFRAMQLESTLFGIVIIQIKPQLERLLGLPAAALTKEIKLTQDLMQLFIDYQVPADLLTFDGDDDLAVTEKVNIVRSHVKRIHDMIKEQKEKELDDQLQAAESAVLEDYANGGTAFASNSGGVKFHKMKSARRQASKSAGRGAHDAGKVQPMMMEFANAAEGQVSGVLMSAAYSTTASAAAPGGDGSTAPGTSASIANDDDLFGASALRMGAASGEPVDMASSAHNEAGAPWNNRDPSRINDQSDGPGSGSDDGDSGKQDWTGEHQTSNDGDVLVAGYTHIPAALDRKLEQFDDHAAVRPTKLSVGSTWSKKSTGLLSGGKTTTSSLSETDQKRERTIAMDLIDALSRSGDLDLGDACLHVVIAATHCFDQTVMDTLTCNNINPIERLEKSALLMASTIHSNRPVSSLLAAAAGDGGGGGELSPRARLAKALPSLFANESKERIAYK